MDNPGYPGQGEHPGVVGGTIAAARPMLDLRAAPGAAARQLGHARDATSITRSVLRSLVRGAPSSPLNISLGAVRRFGALNGDTDGPSKRLAMLSLELDEVRQVSKAHGATVNDVLLTVVAGGLGRWLAARGQPARRPLRALVPVSRPHPDPADPAGNRLSGYLVELPVGEPDPFRRLALIQAAMTANKDRGPTRGPGAFAVLASFVPPSAHRLAAPFLRPLSASVASRLFNTVITSVPFPDVGQSLAGARLAEIFPVAPLAAGQALSVAISTYRGSAHIGLHADHAAIPDLERFEEHLEAALAELTDR